MQGPERFEAKFYIDDRIPGQSRMMSVGNRYFMSRHCLLERGSAADDAARDTFVLSGEEAILPLWVTKGGVREAAPYEILFQDRICIAGGTALLVA